MEKLKINHYRVFNHEALKTTLYVMNHLQRNSLTDKNFITWIHSRFKNSCGSCLLKDLWNFMKKNFTFKYDEFDEVLISPPWLLSIKSGDCDDFSLFASTVLTALGVKNNYVLFGKERLEPTHIAVLSGGIIVDGANENFNIISDKYNFMGVVDSTYPLNIIYKRLIHAKNV